jgi:uncharacterized membrane protein
MVNTTPFYLVVNVSMELIVLLAAFKYFFVEVGEQFIFGFQTSKKVGLKPTIKITLSGVIITLILYFLYFHFRFLIPTNVLELILGITLYYFSFKMFKEVITPDDNDDQDNNKSYRYGYILLVTMESFENSSVLAALTFVDISGALVGAIIPILIFVIIVLKSRSIFDKIPLSKLRLISGILLALIATPLIIYSTGLFAPQWLHWIIPPLD